MLGPNGVGKSTIFNLITGLIKPDYGSILFNGTNVLDYPISERTTKFKIGYVPQKISIDWTLPLKVNDFMVLTDELDEEKINEAAKSATEASLVKPHTITDQIEDLEKIFDTWDDKKTPEIEGMGGRISAALLLEKKKAVIGKMIKDTIEAQRKAGEKRQKIVKTEPIVQQQDDGDSGISEPDYGGSISDAQQSVEDYGADFVGIAKGGLLKKKSKVKINIITTLK